MNASKEQPKMTAGLDLGDKYSYLCLIELEVFSEPAEVTRVHLRVPRPS